MFINRSQSIVDKHWTKKESETEQAKIVIDVFFDGSQPFGVKYADIDYLIFFIRQANGFSPNPDAFRFWIGSRTNCKACFLFE